MYNKKTVTVAQEPEESGKPDTTNRPLLTIFKALGTRNDSVKRTIKRIKEKNGKNYGYSAVSQVIHGGRETNIIVESFLEVAEEMQEEKAALEARAQEMAAKVSA